MWVAVVVMQGSPAGGARDGMVQAWLEGGSDGGVIDTACRVMTPDDADCRLGLGGTRVVWWFLGGEMPVGISIAPR